MAGIRSISRKRLARPRPVAARAVEPVEAAVDLGAIVGAEPGVGRQRRPGIGLVHHVEPDPVEVEVGRAPQVADQRGTSS